MAVRARTTASLGNRKMAPSSERPRAARPLRAGRVLAAGRRVHAEGGTGSRSPGGGRRKWPIRRFGRSPGGLAGKVCGAPGRPRLLPPEIVRALRYRLFAGAGLVAPGSVSLQQFSCAAARLAALRSGLRSEDGHPRLPRPDPARKGGGGSGACPEGLFRKATGGP